MSDTDSPRFGDEVDPVKLAESLEAYAAKLRNGNGYLTGINIDHRAHHDEWTHVALTIETVAHADVPLLDGPVYEDREDEP